ncbi:MAG: DNA polymerase IV [Methylocystis sp.]|nr:DNA polymerase IV [Methylocystis sp.]MCA3590865.1 DNA polymerase IV [Methylocystis sp.]
MAMLCRDCLTWSEPGLRCASCGSLRVLQHPELKPLSVAHIDCDAFYAAVEKRDNPALRDKPVIIGGGQRGVVSTACYIARTFGVRSAMPMFKALAACPQAVVIKPDMEKYTGVGRQVRGMMRALTPLVEPLSIDEAFLDLSGTERLHHAIPAEVLARFAKEVERAVGITVSVGLSYNKFLAKVASDLDKPKGFSVIGRAETLDFLAPRPVGLIWGVGKAMQDRLAQDGIRTIGNLRQHQESDLFRRYGTEGGRLYRLARGMDKRPVQPERETKSVSAETTFNNDIRDFEALVPILWELSEKVHRRLKAQDLAGSTVTLKLKTSAFKLLSRSRTGEATQLARRIFEPAKEMLAPEARGRQAFRLIGVGVSGLVQAGEADRGNLLDHELKRDIATESAVDAIRARFGNAAVIRGTAIGAGKRRGKD